MQDDRVNDRAQIFRNNAGAFTIDYLDARRAGIDISKLLDALNAWEERNETE